MNSLNKRMTLGLICALVLIPAAFAGSRHGPAVKVSRAWTPATPPGAPTAVGYLTITNPGPRPDRLLSLSSPSAASVGLHLMSMDGGIMRMRPVEGGLVVPAGGAVQLEPGGYHLMFEGLKHPFKAGERLPLTLRFQRSGLIRTNVNVEPAGAGAMPGMAMPMANPAR